MKIMQPAGFTNTLKVWFIILAHAAEKGHKTWKQTESDCTPWLEGSVLELSSKTPVASTEDEEEEKMED